MDQDLPIAQAKAALRPVLAARRLALPAAEHAALSDRLCRHLAAWLAARGVRQVFLFHPVRGEPDLTGLRRLAPQLRFALPVAGAGGTLTFHPWADDAALAPNRFGILEPRPGPGAPPLVADGATAVVTPCLALDRLGVRLGYGGGYYDRFLRQDGAAAVAVAALFDGFLVERLPAEPHDVRLGWVATEAGVRATGGLD